MKKTIIVLITAIILYGCKDGSSPTSTNDVHLYIGTWVHSYVQQDSIVVSSREESFDYLMSGYQFQEDGQFIYRGTGWCGTPPITYFNYEGTWVEAEDSVLAIEVESWDGMQNYNLRIIEISDDTLKTVIQ